MRIAPARSDRLTLSWYILTGPTLPVSLVTPRHAENQKRSQGEVWSVDPTMCEKWHPETAIPRGRVPARNSGSRDSSSRAGHDVDTGPRWVARRPAGAIGARIQTVKETNAVMTWHTCALGDGQMAPGPAAEIVALFSPVFEAAGRPADMAVFTRHESEGRLHCEVIAYFSPAAARVATAIGAEPCERPAPGELGLLAGDARCWSVLFPERGA